jgi:cobalt-zinc-cadmium efflux system membrane fusion protein
VFVETEEGLEARSVRLGRATEQQVEIVDGLQPGERYAATNVLALKAQLDSDALEHAGHAH